MLLLPTYPIWTFTVTSSFSAVSKTHFFFISLAFFPLSCNDNNDVTYKWPNSSFFNLSRELQTIFVHYFFNWQIGPKNLTKGKFIVEPSFFTSWTITSVNAHGRTCKKTKVYIYLYISLYENLFENGCIYIYIYIYIYHCSSQSWALSKILFKFKKYIYIYIYIHAEKYSLKSYVRGANEGFHMWEKNKPSMRIANNVFFTCNGNDRSSQNYKPQ